MEDERKLTVEKEVVKITQGTRPPGSENASAAWNLRRSVCGWQL